MSKEQMPAPAHHNIINQLALIFDDTHILHEKNTNSEYQRRSYSDQKKKFHCANCSLPTQQMSMSFDMYGPFCANQNNAQITKISLQDSSGLQSHETRKYLFLTISNFLYALFPVLN